MEDPAAQALFAAARYFGGIQQAHIGPYAARVIGPEKKEEADTYFDKRTGAWRTIENQISPVECRPAFEQIKKPPPEWERLRFGLV